MFYLAIAVFRCSVMTAVNTPYKLFRVLVLEWREPTVDCYQLQPFELTAMSISDYTVLIIFNEYRGGMSVWQVASG